MLQSKTDKSKITLYEEAKMRPTRRTTAIESRGEAHDDDERTGSVPPSPSIKPMSPIGGRQSGGRPVETVIENEKNSHIMLPRLVTTSQQQQYAPISRSVARPACPPSRHAARRPPSSLLARAALLATFLIIIPTLLCSLLALRGAQASGVAPTIDYSHNMRVLKLPKSTKPGEIIYRLRGSDGDPNSQLHFGVAGINGRALLDIVQVPGSWNEADVYLRTRLDHTAEGNINVDPLELSDQAHASHQGDLLNPLYATIYNLTIYVADATNKTTQVDSTILVTNDELLEDYDGSSSDPSAGYETAGDSEQRKYLLNGASHSGSSSSSMSSPTTTTTMSHHHHTHQANDSAHTLKLPTLGTMTRVNSHQLSPFIRPRHVFGVPENGQPGESIGFLTVRESDKSDLPVRFELRGRGSDHFAIRYVFGPRGQSRAELVLSQAVDYEKQNLFQLKVLALNAWTNVKYDTRNVAALDIVITVGDMQDTPPQFKELPHALRLTNAMRPGDVVGRVQAEDGDYADQRPIGYALDAGSPLSAYFTIDKQSGEIKLLRPLQELSLSQQNLAASGAGLGTDPTSGSMLQLTVFASELPDSSSYDHLWPPMFARAEIPLLMVDLINEPPQFIGGWLTETTSGGANPASGTMSPVPTLRAFVREFVNGHHGGVSGSNEANGARGRPGLSGLGGPSSDGTSPGQLVQWYTTRNHSLDGHELNGATGSAQESIASLQQQLLKASRGRPMVVDFGQGLNGTFQLTLEGPDAHLFELEPNYPVSKQSLFNLFVAPDANRSLFDSDTFTRATLNAPEPVAKSFHVELVARDFGIPHRMSARIKCLIDLVDINDNAPQFDLALYTFSIFENAQLGQIIGSIRARDMDRMVGAGGSFSGQQQRVRYTSLTGRDNNLFRLDEESGLITLEGPLDREKQDHYLLLAEARDVNGQAANYTKVLVNILDVNDNAPVFSQNHYDAVLLADGTFYQPLVVSATDADEPSSANSQVAYEIIAGNQNDQFAIDSLSGTIYPTGSSGGGPGSPPVAGGQPGGVGGGGPIRIPSILSEPIVPFQGTRNQNKQQPDLHGKILPSPSAHGHEIEETTAPTSRLHQQQPNNGPPFHLSWPRSVPISFNSAGGQDEPRPEQGASLDLLQQENGRYQVRDASSMTTTAQPASDPSRQPATAQSQRGPHPTLDRDLPTGGHSQQQFDASKVPPVTTLVIRAHDFGIPLRSATCKVNIYNQALLSRSLSVILNGTAEQLEQRRELIERSFGALTGSRAQIESIDALSDSSSLSVARLKLAVPAGHSLIDLTDLSALMTAIDYKPASGSNCPTLQQQQQQQNLDQFRHPVHYITTGDKIYPVHHAQITNNISATVPGGNSATAIFTDIQSLDSASNMLERKLLFYIIIVGICILALLVIWMIYFCCREDQHQQRMKKVESSGRTFKSGRGTQKDSVDNSDLSHENSTANAAGQTRKGRHFKNKSLSRTNLVDEHQSQLAKSVSQLNLDEHHHQPGSNKTQAKTTMGAQHPIGNNLLKQQQLSIPSNIKPEHYSMYNGQIWFEQGGLMRSTNGLTGGATTATTSTGGRRASSAPSVGGHSLDSGLHAIINGRSSAMSPVNSGLTTPQRGQFFPNTLGYAENLATMAAPSAATYIYPTGSGGQRKLTGRRSLVKSRGRVVPMTMLGGVHDYTNEAFEPDLESGGLVMMPFVGATGSMHRGARAKGEHRHHHHKSKTQSTSSSSASRSGSTRTLDEEDELDHESVLLDSDQELLGFDSTGTPIIATRTRHKPESSTNLLLAPDLTVQTPTNGASSPAATVINMGQSKQLDQPNNNNNNNNKETTLPKQSGGREALPLAAGGTTKDLVNANSTSSERGDYKRDKEETQDIESQSSTSKGDVAQQSGISSMNVNEVGGKKEATATKQEDSNAPIVGKSLDLMSELNERLSSANKQRALKRQGANDKQPDEPTQNRQRGQILTNKTTSDEATHKPLVGAAYRKQSAPADTDGAKLAVGASLDTSNKANRATQEDSTQRQQGPATKRRASETISLQSQSTISDGTITTVGDQEDRLRDMKNGELLEKQSIFALTYSGLATDKLPS